MYATFYCVTQDLKSRWRRQFPPDLRAIVAPAQCGDFICLYDQPGCLDILKFLFPNVALYIKYDLIPIDVAVGEVE